MHKKVHNKYYLNMSFSDFVFAIRYMEENAGGNKNLNLYYNILCGYCKLFLRNLCEL
jgi:hypothetical protein